MGMVREGKEGIEEEEGDDDELICNRSFSHTFYLIISPSTTSMKNLS